MRQYRYRHAFTLIEVVFVLIVLSIVASIGAKIIAQVYEAYLLERASYRTASKTDLVANFIVNRLNYAVPGSEIARENVESTTYIPVYGIAASGSTDYKVLQWYGYEAESFDAGGWSGVINLNSALNSNTILETPGSNLSVANTVSQELHGTIVGLVGAAVIFPSLLTPTTIGYDANTTNIHPITGFLNTAPNSGPLFQFASTVPAPRRVSEHYQLVGSSYAIAAEDDGRGEGTYDLYFYYNFRPWLGEGNHLSDIADSNTNRQLLMRRVSVFRFTATPNAIRFKICQKENLTSNSDTIATCKEKVVMR